MLYKYVSSLLYIYVAVSYISTNYALERHTIPVFDEVNFVLNNHIAPDAIKNNSNRSIFKIATQTTHTSFEDIVSIINNSLTIEVNTQKKEQITLFLQWLNQHIKNGILYHNNMEIHGWIHQCIYAIEILNVPFLYEWLLGYILLSPQLYRFDENIVTKDMLQKNDPSLFEFIFDDPDFFYPYLFFFIINGPIYNKEVGLLLHSNITIIEKNSIKTLDFFKNIRDKYKKIVDGQDGSDEEQAIFEEADELIGNITLLVGILEMIIHENSELQQLKTPKIEIIYQK